MSDRMEEARLDLAAMFCGNCRDYKGMQDNPETGERECIFCS
jgi:hypothetical protein